MTLKDDLCSTKKGETLWYMEKARLDISEMICKIMEDDGVSREELSVRTNLSVETINKFLDGPESIRNVSRFLTALGYEFVPGFRKLSASEER